MQKEVLIQKTLHLAFENSLQSRGIRKSDIQIIREAQYLNNMRIDFLISYGIIGPVLVELKLANNTGGTTKAMTEYKESHMLKYMSQFNCPYGLFLIFNTSLKKDTFEERMNKAQKTYKDVPNINVKGLNILHQHDGGVEFFADGSRKSFRNGDKEFYAEYAKERLEKDFGDAQQHPQTQNPICSQCKWGSLLVL